MLCGSHLAHRWDPSNQSNQLAQKFHHFPSTHIDLFLIYLLVSQTDFSLTHQNPWRVKVLDFLLPKLSSMNELRSGHFFPFCHCWLFCELGVGELLTCGWLVKLSADLGCPSLNCGCEVALPLAFTLFLSDAICCFFDRDSAWGIISDYPKVSSLSSNPTSGSFLWLLIPLCNQKLFSRWYTYRIIQRLLPLLWNCKCAEYRFMQYKNYLKPLINRLTGIYIISQKWMKRP